MAMGSELDSSSRPRRVHPGGSVRLGHGSRAHRLYLRTINLNSASAWTRLALGANAAALVVIAIATDGQYVVNVMGVAAALIVLVVALPGNKLGKIANVTARVLEILPLRYLGLVSCSLYLWHFAVIWWIQAHGFYDSTTLPGWS
jgi:peptidoglycan/LPS O-acetylase OafA/YrhL